MPTVQQARGDVNLVNQKDLKTGQIFWSYVNTDPKSSNGHTHSEGQLWIKDPSSNNLTEVANRRSLNAFKFQGYINKDFHGDFIHADENTQAAFRHCHTGDFWIFSSTQTFVKSEAEDPIVFHKGEILLITDAIYALDAKEDDPFRQNLKFVDYIKIPLPVTDNKDIDTEDYNETVNILAQRIFYRGEIDSADTFYKGLDNYQKTGYTFCITENVKVSAVYFNENSIQLRGNKTSNTVSLRPGDLIHYTGQIWEIIPTGQSADYIAFKPDEDLIDSTTTFDDWMRDDLKKLSNVNEALNYLAANKAHLGKDGKLPYEQLPEAVAHGLTLQGIWYPLKNNVVDPNSAEGQNTWPEKDNSVTNLFWIVDCYGKTNVQYIDYLNPGRVVELNTGDFIVWSTETLRYEIIDNSDRFNALEVYVSTAAGKKVTLLGNVGLQGSGKIKITVGNNNDIIIGGDKLISQDMFSDGEAGYFPIYAGDGTELTKSVLFQDDDAIVKTADGEDTKGVLKTLYGFTIGNVDSRKVLETYGQIGIHKTVGATKTTYINNCFFIDTAHTKQNDNKVFFRRTRLYASERNNFADGDEVLDIYYPEASSTLIASFLEDDLTRNYFTKTNKNGFITDSLTKEETDVSSYQREVGAFDENYNDGFINQGIGRTASEDLESGEITFYAKTKDKEANSPYRVGSIGGFYTDLHSVINGFSQGANQTEHLLKRTKVRTRLVINPSVLEDEIETFVKMPTCSGTLLTWEELLLAYGNGVPLMIPAWELMDFRTYKDVIGLDTSPITIKLNRKKHDHTKYDRENDLSKDYGPGVKSTWSYIGSSHEGSLQEKRRGPIDDVVEFDSWLEAQRSIASNEAFILPASSRADSKSTIDPKTLDYLEDENEELNNDYYGRGRSGGMYQRILPSKSIYASEPQYYDPITGKAIPQNVIKDVEMPAEGGVLLTSRSRIDGGWWDENT